MKFFLLCLLVSQSAFAKTSILSRTSLGGASFSQLISVSSDFSETGSWNLDYTYLKSSTTDATTGVDLSNATSEFTAGALWLKNWEYGFDLTYTTTPSEGLRSLGPTLLLGYDFESGINLKGEVTYLSYSQSFSLSGRRGTRSFSGSNAIGQTEFRTTLSFDLFSFFSFILNYSIFSYTKDVNQFLSTLDSTRGLITGTSGLSNALAGFSSQIFGGTFVFYPADSWEFDLRYTLYQSASDNSTSSAILGKVFYRFNNNLKLAAGYERDTSANVTDNIFLADLRYTFD